MRAALTLVLQILFVCPYFCFALPNADLAAPSEGEGLAHTPLALVVVYDAKTMQPECEISPLKNPEIVPDDMAGATTTAYTMGLASCAENFVGILSADVRTIGSVQEAGLGQNIALCVTGGIVGAGVGGGLGVSNSTINMGAGFGLVPLGMATYGASSFGGGAAVRAIGGCAAIGAVIGFFGAKLSGF